MHGLDTEALPTRTWRPGCLMDARDMFATLSTRRRGVAEAVDHKEARWGRGPLGDESRVFIDRKVLRPERSELPIFWFGCSPQRL
jgi:hypothetical protein